MTFPQRILLRHPSLPVRAPTLRLAGSLRTTPLCHSNKTPRTTKQWQRHSSTSSGAPSGTPSSTTVSTPSNPSRFQRVVAQFKDKPASHLVAFGILHELTAVVPLPIVYFGLEKTGVQIPFPAQVMEDANKAVARVAAYYGWDLSGADGARMMLNMATSYAVVKALMPVRLALCAWMTPWTARRVVGPVMGLWKRFRKV